MPSKFDLTATDQINVQIVGVSERLGAHIENCLKQEKLAEMFMKNAHPKEFAALVEKGMKVMDGEISIPSVTAGGGQGKGSELA